MIPPIQLDSQQVALRSPKSTSCLRRVARHERRSIQGHYGALSLRRGRAGASCRQRQRKLRTHGAEARFGGARKPGVLEVTLDETVLLQRTADAPQLHPQLHCFVSTAVRATRRAHASRAMRH